MTHENKFDGITYDPEKDGPRLTGQLAKVRAVMADGEWRTLAEISELTGYVTTSVSARLRDLRKPKHGGYLVERERVAHDEGLWRYRFTLVRGEQGPPRPAQLTPFAMRGAIDVLRRIYPRLNAADRQAIEPLGKWLGTSLGEKPS